MKLQNSLRLSSVLAFLAVLGTFFLLAGPASAQFSPEEIAFLDTVQIIPANAADMMPYDRTERKLLLRSMTGTAQSDFWNSKLQDYLDSHPALSESQVELIEYVRSIATPQFFASTDNDLFRPVVDTMIEGLSTAALEVFDAKEFATIFIGLGDEPAQCSSGGTELPGRAPTKGACNCRWGQGCGGCLSGVCDITTDGCGFLGMERCTKTCIN